MRDVVPNPPVDVLGPAVPLAVKETLGTCPFQEGRKPRLKLHRLTRSLDLEVPSIAWVCPSLLDGRVHLLKVLHRDRLLDTGLGVDEGDRSAEVGDESFPKRLLHDEPGEVVSDGKCLVAEYAVRVERADSLEGAPRVLGDVRVQVAPSDHLLLELRRILRLEDLWPRTEPERREPERPFIRGNQLIERLDAHYLSSVSCWTAIP